MKKGFVYLICDPEKDKFKIGVTNKPIEKRIKELQTGNASELFISSYYQTEHPFRLETMLHNKYKTQNVLNEWFDLSASEAAHFIETCDKLEEIIKSLVDNPFFSDDLK